MATWLRQSTAQTVIMGPFVDDVDGKTQETALTITEADIRLSKNGQPFANKNGTVTLTHDDRGWYRVALDATDTNTLGALVVAIHESGALPVWREFMVMPAAIYDAMVSPGTSLLAVNATQIEGVDATNQIRDSVFGGVVENGKTFQQYLRGIIAALMGKSSGLDGTTAIYRDNADTKNRISATVDEFGNRSAITTDLD